jgi:hypothetical protein
LTVDPDQVLRDEIAEIGRELESLTLEKSHRDRRLQLNEALRLKTAQLEARQRSHLLEARLRELTAKEQAAASKAERREVQRELARVQAELDEVGPQRG